MASDPQIWPQPIILLNNVATGTGAWIPISSAIRFVGTISWTGGSSSGTVVWEAASQGGAFAPTVSQLIDTIAWVADSTEVSKAYLGPYLFVRPRISVSIGGGGKVTVRMQAYSR